jgi:formylglycine-generating enzyme required for sulfatase activity
MKKALFYVFILFSCFGLFAQQPVVPDNMVRIEGGTFTMGQPLK